MAHRADPVSQSSQWKKPGTCRALHFQAVITCSWHCSHSARPLCSCRLLKRPDVVGRPAGGQLSVDHIGPGAAFLRCHTGDHGRTRTHCASVCHSTLTSHVLRAGADIALRPTFNVKELLYESRCLVQRIARGGQGHRDAAPLCHPGHRPA